MVPSKELRTRRVGLWHKHRYLLIFTKFSRDNQFKLLSIVALLPLYALFAFVYTMYITPALSYLMNSNLDEIKQLPPTSQTAIMIGYSGFILASISFFLTTISFTLKSIADLIKGWRIAVAVVDRDTAKYYAYSGEWILKKEVRETKLFQVRFMRVMLMLIAILVIILWYMVTH